MERYQADALAHRHVPPDGLLGIGCVSEPVKRVIADRGYDANRIRANRIRANRIRAALREQGTIPVIPGRRNRKRPIQYDERRYKDRWRVEAMFCRLKELGFARLRPRQSATRYDTLARASCQP